MSSTPPCSNRHQWGFCRLHTLSEYGQNGDSSRFEAEMLFCRKHCEYSRLSSLAADWAFLASCCTCDHISPDTTLQGSKFFIVPCLATVRLFPQAFAELCYVSTRFGDVSGTKGRLGPRDPKKVDRDAISFPEPTILLVCAKDRDLWPPPTPEVRESRTHCQLF